MKKNEKSFTFIPHPSSLIPSFLPVHFFPQFFSLASFVERSTCLRAVPLLLCHTRSES
jgi:hypothetical protein